VAFRARFRVSISAIAIVTFVVLIIYASYSASAITRYYAGYRLQQGYYGVSGSIYTINPDVTGENIFAQWVCIVVDPTRGYMVQLGYTKGYDTNYSLVFYAEIVDALGHWVALFGTPEPGTTYTYTIVAGTYDGIPVWYGYIRQGGELLYDVMFYTTSLSSYELQAFSETTSTDIVIDGTHFSDLAYYTGRDFSYWYTHTAYVDSPYWMEEISDYEFMAWGGGSVNPPQPLGISIVG